MYLDANNLYRNSMMQLPPVVILDWVNPEKVCVLEVDLLYPDDFHDLHNDYPLAPEKVKASKQKLSHINYKSKKKRIFSW